MTTSAFMSLAYFYISIFFFFYPKYEHFPISAFAENKSLRQEYIFMEKSMFRSSHQT